MFLFGIIYLPKHSVCFLNQILSTKMLFLKSSFFLQNGENAAQHIQLTIKYFKTLKWSYKQDENFQNRYLSTILYCINRP